jgi:hypothetical protein
LEVKVELVPNAVALFLGGAPRYAHTWPGGVRKLGISRGHGTPNRSIRERERQPEEEWPVFGVQ